jgi:hypothetical protein
LTEDDIADLARLLRETIGARPLPAVAEDQAAADNPGEARSAGAAAGAAAATEAAGRARRGTGAEAVEVADTCYGRSTVTISLSI